MTPVEQTGEIDKMLGTIVQNENRFSKGIQSVRSR